MAVVDSLNIRHRLGDRIDNVALGAIERLGNKCDSGPRGQVGGHFAKLYDLRLSAFAIEPVGNVAGVATAEDQDFHPNALGAGHDGGEVFGEAVEIDLRPDNFEVARDERISGSDWEGGFLRGFEAVPFGFIQHSLKEGLDVFFDEIRTGGAKFC
jgi:hypothetical protein